MMSIDETFYRQAVIRPPADFDTRRVDEGKQIDRIVIDSRDRNRDFYPDPNAYTIDLYEEITNVISARLICADVPFSAYLVNSSVHSIPFTCPARADAVSIAVLTTGDYTPVELATEMTRAMNAAAPGRADGGGGPPTFSVSYITSTDNFRFTCNERFVLDFSASMPNTVRVLTGFSSASIPSHSETDGTHTVSSPYRRNFNYNNYIVMFIEQFGCIRSVSKVIDNAFAVFGRQSSTLDVSDPVELVKYFNPIMPRLVRLSVRFKDAMGNLYDFQNADHRFDLIVESYKHRAHNRHFGTNQ